MLLCRCHSQRLASTITIEAHVRTAIRRCCPAHPDWKTLARHLLADFAGIPTEEIFEGLRQAKHAGEFFNLTAADALDCAELMVRYHVLNLHPSDDRETVVHIGETMAFLSPTAADRLAGGMIIVSADPARSG